MPLCAAPDRSANRTPDIVDTPRHDTLAPTAAAMPDGIRATAPR